MKRLITHQLVVSTLLAACLFVSVSQQALAAKPPPKNQVVIQAVTVDAPSHNILVTGSGLLNATAVSLGGVDVQSAINGGDALSLNLSFNASTANAVPEAGNYLLVVEGKEFSVYFTSAIFDATTPATCPCVIDWTGSTKLPPGGLIGMEPVCAIQSASGDQTSVLFYDEPLAPTLAWILSTEYNDSAKECALAGDEPPRPITQQEHAACSTYIEVNHIAPYAPVDTCALVLP
jgi:hypothetical protein